MKKLHKLRRIPLKSVPSTANKFCYNQPKNLERFLKAKKGSKKILNNFAGEGDGKRESNVNFINYKSKRNLCCFYL